MAHEEHRARGQRVARFYIVTVSTSRYREKAEGRTPVDESGDLAERMAREAGHQVVGRDLIPDDLHLIRSKILELAAREDVDVVVFTGGTGLTKTDVTIEAVRPLFEKEMEGFGDVFRYYSIQEVGTAAFLTRATGGVVGGKAVFLLPGSPNAVKVGMRIILDEVSHLLYLVK
ncbi:MogA/MoaB family molybdenum cofactor biosynthesis protein [Pyrobaculum neutrophilum]|uniref:Molybdenum cofactor synthesis domain protein n=1 Tax=Pyrobaculum neutrophilum (strain DSM 2338 / JCM 9278 / NBRC 100436 / V24Sta) TaxID=444157 RepID=B1YAL8_PYRNV|nr:MogA/MoaB family molybdenum cofactor biosynthesis protein [Pyrobaculum neutrophilum]ACB39097.1 molybdenum cofactor synthesis domain protein [Pyrobaculum neutrophilum V24Sta]